MRRAHDRAEDRRRRQIALRLALDGKGRYDVRTGIRFLDHMLELVARHGGFDLTLAGARRPRRRSASHGRGHRHRARRGGLAALGNRRGINRAGYFVMPMDETLAVAAIDLGGRVHAVVDLRLKVRTVGDLQAELVHRLLRGLRAGRARQRARQGPLRTIEPSSRRGGVQGVRPRAARRVRARSPAGADAAEHEGSAVIALIDYGAGNLTSVRKGFAAAGAELFTPREPAELAQRAGDRRARRRSLRRDRRARRRVAHAIRSAVERGTPLLGICLGMQWLFEGSDEAPDVAGLGADRGPMLAAAAATAL